MTTRKRQPLLPREKREAPPASAESPATQPSASAAENAPEQSAAEAAGPASAPPESARVWVLPTAPGGFWAVAEEQDRVQSATRLRSDPPALLTQPLNAIQKAQAVKASRESLVTEMRNQCHESAFQLLKRVLLGLGWVTVAAVSLRLPGELRMLDAILLVTGFVYLGYSVLRYGSILARWQGRRVDAEHAFSNVICVRSALVGRLSAAMKLRHTTKANERGTLPDEELLDTSAYRKLIKDNVATREELVALGKAVSAALGLNKAGADERRISELAVAAGLDAESAIFYRDMAHAIREIELTPDELNA
jgi:hypothetical protein